MRNVFFIILAFTMASTYASNMENLFESNEMEKFCQKAAQFTPSGSVNKLKAITADDKFLYFAFRGAGNNNGEVIFKNKQDHSEKLFKLEGQIHNIQLSEGEVLITTDTELFVIDKEDHSLKFKTNTLPSGMRSLKNARPYGVYKFNNIYYIAHGKHGVVPFDSLSMKHLPAILPTVPQPNTQLTSIVTDIVGVEEHAYLAFDNLNLDPKLRGFEGVMIFNLITGKVEHTIPVNQQIEAYHMPNLTIDNEELIVTNLGLNFRHKLNSLTRSKFMDPLKRIWKYPLGSLIGRGFIQDKKIYGCFKDHQKKVISSGWMSLE